MGGATSVISLVGSLLGPVLGSMFQQDTQQPDMSGYHRAQEENQMLQAQQQADMKASMDAQNALMQKQYEESAAQNAALKAEAQKKKAAEEQAMAQSAEKARKQHLAAIQGGSQMTLLTRGTSAEEMTGGKKTQLGG